MNYDEVEQHSNLMVSEQNLHTPLHIDSFFVLSPVEYMNTLRSLLERKVSNVRITKKSFTCTLANGHVCLCILNGMVSIPLEELCRLTNLKGKGYVDLVTFAEEV